MSRQLTRSEAQSAFANLSTKFRHGAVGQRYLKLLGLMNEAGVVPLATALEAIFPGEPHDKAREKLSKLVIARAPTDASGSQSPMRVVTTLLYGSATLADASLWFGQDASDTTPPVPDTPRHSASRFIESEGMQRDQRQVGALIKSEQAAELHKNQTSKTLLTPATEEAYEPYGEPRISATVRAANVHMVCDTRQMNALRGIDSKNYEDAADGHETLGLSSDNSGTRVKALKSLLKWAAARHIKQPKLPLHRLMALLGDYGTGKTSHAMQFARVLNGEVAHEDWAQTIEQLRAANLPVPAALYVDLAVLQPVNDLTRLSLQELLALALAYGKGEGINAHWMDQASKAMAQARAGELIVVFDGLDELLSGQRQSLSSVFDQLLKLLVHDGKPSRARVLVSCRTHYFRDMAALNGFFSTRERGIAQADEYLCLHLLPWDEKTVSAYLHRRLPANQAEALLTQINTLYNLKDLASRPVLLALMTENVGELLRRHPDGQAMGAASLYNLVVDKHLVRDAEKHQILQIDKPLLMGALASRMWSEGSEQWSADRLDRWLPETAQTLFGSTYLALLPNQWQALQDDLRTATFIVRPGVRDFSFAHRSLLEYFLARFVMDVLGLLAQGHLNVATARAYLPSRPLNAEALHFAQELWADRARHHGTTWERQCAQALWAILQVGSEPSDGLPAKLEAAHPLHQALWGLVVPLGAAVLPHAPVHPEPLNLRGLNFSDQHWTDLDFSALPGLDLRGASLLGLFAQRVRFGRVLCDEQTLWAQALLRDGDASGIAWGGSACGGLLVRSGPLAWPGASGKPRLAALRGPWTMPMLRSSVRSVALSADGARVLTGNHDHSARLWDAATGRELQRFLGHRGKVTSVALSTDGARVLTGSRDGSARLWDAATGRELRRFIGHWGGINGVALSTDGVWVLTGSHDGFARLWDAATGRELRCFAGHGGEVRSVALSAERVLVLTGSDDGIARLWDASTGRELHRFTGHGGGINSVALSADGLRVLTGGHDRSAGLWDAATGRELRRFTAHAGWINSVALNATGERVLTGSHDRSARLWDATTGRMLRRFGGDGGVVSGVALSVDGNCVLTGSRDGSARLFDTTTGRELQRFTGYGSELNSVALSADGARVLIGSDDGTARLWEATSGRQLRSISGTRGGAALNGDGARVLTGSRYGIARLWDAATGHELQRFTGPSDGVSSLALSADGQRVLTGASDRIARLWDAATGHVLQHFKCDKRSAISSVALSADGARVLIGAGDRKARLWDAATGRRLQCFTGHGARINSVALSADGAQALTGSDDGSARLWDAATGHELQRFIGHEGGVSSVALSADGVRVLTGSDDGSARLWDLAKGLEMRRFIGHGGPVTSVALSADGTRLLTGSRDGSARLWVCDRDGALESIRIFFHTAAVDARWQPSSALFDAAGNLLDADEVAADTWLWNLCRGTPMPLELAPTADLV